MRLYNTLTRKIENFEPLADKRVGMYTCGPTVYDRAHLGNMRTYLLSDTLVRTLKFFGYSVTHVMNITDIDDKTIARADRENVSLSEVTIRYETLFLEDLEQLNILLPDVTPRATEHFAEMKQLLNTLVDKEYAYERNGEVYFDISRFKPYGRLSQLDKRKIIPGARVNVQEYDKDDVSDFVLWKVDEVTKQHQHELTRGGGRPGWHLECSAMSMKYLGPTLDIHVGGVDLLFPHHENEIAQSEAATEREFVRYFVHGEHMMVDGQRMGKSLGNVYMLADVIERGIDPLAFRYLVLSTHYRSKLNFTWESLEAAGRTLQSIRELAYRSEALSGETRRDALEQSTEALGNDLDTPRVLALLHEANSFDLWEAFEPVLGLGLKRPSQTLPGEVHDLLQKREAARRAGNFTEADSHRDVIEQLGYRLEDTPNGPRIIPTKP